MKSFVTAIFSLLLVCAVSVVSADERGPVNINTDSVETLTQLSGIGESRAEAIVEWREENGDFVSVDQLAEVQGIGPATIDANREMMTLE